MIYALAKAICTRLRTRGFPVAVGYGPERTLREVSRAPVIIFERDRQVGDIVGPPVGGPTSPTTKRCTHTRALGVLVRVYASSSKPNARVNEHEALCDQIVDGLLVELHRVQTRDQTGPIQIAESRMLPSSEVGEAELPAAGAVYQLRLLIPRAVFDLDFSGDEADTATLAAVTSSLSVSIDGDDYEDVT